MSQSDPEQSPSIFDDEAAQVLDRRLAERVAKARNALHLVAGMLFITDLLGIIIRLGRFGFLQIALPAATDSALIAILVALGFLAKKRPFNALLAGLILYMLAQAVAFVLHIAFMQHSPIISLMIIGLLFSGLRRAQVVQRSLDFGREHPDDFSRS